MKNEFYLKRKKTKLIKVYLSQTYTHTHTKSDSK